MNSSECSAAGNIPHAMKIKRKSAKIRKTNMHLKLIKEFKRQKVVHIFAISPVGNCTLCYDSDTLVTSVTTVILVLEIIWRWLFKFM